MKKLHIVLYEPEIPQNTGNIMRTCVAIDAKLHLIQPLGFSLDDKYLKRSRLDYFKDLEYQVYEHYDAFAQANEGKFYFLSRYGQKTYSDFKFSDVEDENLYLIFGKESTGIDKHILAKHLNDCYRIPTTDKVRSLNLSNAVALVSYEVLRQLDFNTLEKYEPETLKGKRFLIQFLGEE